MGDLMKAEQSAEAVVAAARKTRQAKLKQAKDKAEDDLKVFREEQERKFQKEVGTKANADPSAELGATTRAEAAAVQQQYQQNKKQTIDYIIAKVLEVPTGLTDTQ